MRKFVYLKILLLLCFIGYVFSLFKIFDCNVRDGRATIFGVMGVVFVLLGYMSVSLLGKICRATAEQPSKINIKEGTELACDIFIYKALKFLWGTGFIILILGFVDREVDWAELLNIDGKYHFILLAASLPLAILAFYFVIVQSADFLSDFFHWYSEELYDAEEQFNKGYKYAKRKNYSQAVKWYRKAADQGHAGAQNNLGLCYEGGIGVEQDLEKAVEWYTKAAEQGEKYAQCNLGLCYENGEGVEQDCMKAAKWYIMSAEQGHKRAKKALERLKSEIKTE